jgi:hypothetical protein
MTGFRNENGKPFVRIDILPPEPAGRPRPRAAVRAGEIVDAQFVAVGHPLRGKRGPRSHNDNLRPGDEVRAGTSRAMRQPSGGAATAALAPNAGPIDMLERLLHRIPADLFSAIVAAIFVAVFAAAGGFTFLFHGGSPAPAVPRLAITHVSMIPQDANGMKVLLINGIVENRSDESLAMPSIRADLLDGDRMVTSTLVSPPAHALAGGRSRGFSVRIPHAGGKLPELKLSLAQRAAPTS